ncbi:aminotransferase-like domain-containing protein [Taibaiella koreensis]|uniref:aminotransferase-like domain-containing protein n=1 Tax=Taibaiella koreensis TaxID=1268548 RepID=UPI000E59D6F1|nr:PLP-dependent aminotransferase family protein [Taibaiella koreensis]
MNRDFLYNEIAGRMAHQIRNGVFKAGDRLPSVRALCQEHGISMNTAKRVFVELEAQSLIDSRPQSGYYVSSLPYYRLPLPGVSKPSPIAKDREPEELISKVYANMGNDKLTLLSIGAPSGSLLPWPRLEREVAQAARGLKDGGTGYAPLQGSAQLRKMVAIRSLTWGGRLVDDDLITTNGGMDALSLALMALTKPGDTIAIESPCYPGILQLALSQGLKVLELPTHPTTGIEIEALKKAIPKIKVCLLIPNFNTPLGSCMPDEHKREVVSLLAAHNIPLIEDDVYGDLYYGTRRPKCCKSFDTEGDVIWCGSISKTLAPGYRVGWIAPGRYKAQVLKLKLVHAITSPSVTQEAVGNFLQTGRYEQHLRLLRRTLQDNCQHYMRTIAAHFPEGTKTSRPQGGLALWVELGKQADTTILYELALKKQISIAPGRMFTLQDQYQNCMRLCTGLPWTVELESKLKQLGRMAKLL